MTHHSVNTSIIDGPSRPLPAAPGELSNPEPAVPPSGDASQPAARCIHRTPGGRRCKALVSDSASGLCFHHAQRRQKKTAAEELAQTLTEGINDFTSPHNINTFLSRLLQLLAKDAIPTRRAAVMAYITNQLLRTISVIDHQEAFAEKHPTIIFDLPRPDRSEDPQDEPQMAPQT